MVKDIGRSGTFLNAVSNRLGAASTRARFLGMIVGTAISQLIEPPGKAMRFDLEEMESDEARWYLGLVKTEDSFGSVDAIKSQKGQTHQSNKSNYLFQPPSAARSRPRTTQQSKIVAIEEVEDSGNEDEQVPYENPDVDASDSDDDPTLVRKTKPTPPV